MCDYFSKSQPARKEIVHILKKHFGYDYAKMLITLSAIMGVIKGFQDYEIKNKKNKK